MLINADLAQLAEHVTSNDEVGGSNPLVSTNKTAREIWRFLFNVEIY